MKGRDWTENVELEEGVPIPSRNYSETPASILAQMTKPGQSAFFTNENEAQNFWSALVRVHGGTKSATKRRAWKGKIKGWRVWRVK